MSYIAFTIIIEDEGLTEEKKDELLNELEDLLAKRGYNIDDQYHEEV